MPSVYIVDDSALNAFAVGRKAEIASVAVTSGLLKRLNRDELQGVIGHEIGHIRNLDVRFITLAAVMLGTIVLISDLFLRIFIHGGGRRRSSRSRGGGGGQEQIVLMAIVLLLAILAPILARMFYFACSRRREYLADASSACFTRYPMGLASALDVIGRQGQRLRRDNRALTPLYIINPLQAFGRSGIFSTHPPTEKRIQILRSMGNAGLAAYEVAYRQTLKKRCFKASTLADDKPLAIREGEVRPETRDERIEKARAVNDLLNLRHNYLFLNCACGMRFKVPPGFRLELIQCPRCGKSNPVPTS